jgi:molybdopterin-guanine dinucleotide biosynthesis protein A
VVLAGGLGRRMGTPKATAPLGGRPLIAYPLEALASVCGHVVVVAKRDTELPPGLDRWDEPDEPRHPIAGITHALERANAPILVCAADMPFVLPGALETIAAALRDGRRAVVASADGEIEPLLAAYAPEALATLRAAAPDAALRRIAESLDPVRVEVAAETVFNVNTPEDLAEAERRLRRE